MTLGERLRMLREKKGLSQEELADALDMTYASISNYERDYRTPPLDVLKRLADFFEVSLDYLSGRHEYMYGEGKVKDVKEFLKPGVFTYGDKVLDDKHLAFLRHQFEFLIKEMQEEEKKQEKKQP